jgi:hypothetical protein
MSGDGRRYGASVSLGEDTMVWAILGNEMNGAMAEIINNPSDRVVAILGTSVIDESLRRTLENRFRASSLIDDAFKPQGGVLGTLHAKAQIAYLMRVIEREERLALVGIQEIRNLFAHKLNIRDFYSEDLKEGFEKLKLHEKYQKFPYPFFEGESEFTVPKPTHLRETFLVNLEILTVVLMKDRQQHEPHTGRFLTLPPAPPPSPVVVHFDTPPDEPGTSPEKS